MSCYIACQGSLSTTDAAMDQTTKFTTNGDASGMPVTTELGETAIICDIQGASTSSVKTSKDESTKVTTNGEDAPSMSVNAIRDINYDMKETSTSSVKTSMDESTQIPTNGDYSSSMSVNTQIGESTNSDIQDGSIDIIG